MKTRVCRRCRTRVKKSFVVGYPWFCPEHYEDLFEFETEVIEVPDRKPRHKKHKARRSK
jgi:hypothetical protein